MGVWIAAGMDAAAAQTRFWPQAAAQVRGNADPQQPGHALAYNADKILLGRFWGAEALGIYSRAYQLINLPVDGLNSAISQVALPALARVQDDK